MSADMLALDFPCPLANVSIVNMFITGVNASAEGTIQLNIPDHIAACRFDNTSTYRGFFLLGTQNSGQITFFSSGLMSVSMFVNFSYEGGVYVGTSLGWNATSVMPVASSDVLFSFWNLRLLAIGIIVGGMLAGWFPTVEKMEFYWKRLRGR